MTEQEKDRPMNPIKWFNSLPESKQFRIKSRVYLALEIVMLWILLFQTALLRKVIAEYSWLQTHCTQTDVPRGR